MSAPASPYAGEYTVAMGKKVSDNGPNNIHDITASLSITFLHHNG